MSTSSRTGARPSQHRIIPLRHLLFALLIRDDLCSAAASNIDAWVHNVHTKSLCKTPGKLRLSLHDASADISVVIEKNEQQQHHEGRPLSITKSIFDKDDSFRGMNAFFGSFAKRNVVSGEEETFFANAARSHILSRDSGMEGGILPRLPYSPRNYREQTENEKHGEEKRNLKGPWQLQKQKLPQQDVRVAEEVQNVLQITKKEEEEEDGDWWKMPLILSTLAGMSTCLGAAVVFFLPKKRINSKFMQSSIGTQKEGEEEEGANEGKCVDEEMVQNVRGDEDEKDNEREREETAVINADTMCFSLSLAGSVMVTISVVSLLPQCFASRDMLTVPTITSRVVACALGCMLYRILSWTFPEPDDILWGNIDGTEPVNNYMKRDEEVSDHCASSSSLVASAKSSSFETGSAISVVRKRSFNNGLAFDGTKVRCEDEEFSKEERQKLLNMGMGHENSLTSFSSPCRNDMTTDTSTTLSSSFIEEGDCTVDNRETISSSIFRSGRSDGKSVNGSPQRLLHKSLSASSSSSISVTMATASSSQSFMSKGATRWNAIQGDDLPTKERRRSWRVAMLLFITLLVHNFPEGLAVAASTVQSHTLGWTVAVGIMIHNIPEGVAIAVPCLRARPDWPWLAFWLASASGLAEPLGAAMTVAFIKYAGLRTAATTAESAVAGVDGMDGGLWHMSLEDVLAFVAGIMTTVALYELFPEARRHMKVCRGDSGNDSGDGYASATSFYGGLVIGFVVMLLTELYLPE